MEWRDFLDASVGRCVTYAYSNRAADLVLIRSICWFAFRCSMLASAVCGTQCSVWGIWRVAVATAKEWGAGCCVGDGVEGLPGRECGAVRFKLLPMMWYTYPTYQMLCLAVYCWRSHDLNSICDRRLRAGCVLEAGVARLRGRWRRGACEHVMICMYWVLLFVHFYSSSRMCCDTCSDPNSNSVQRMSCPAAAYCVWVAHLALSQPLLELQCANASPLLLAPRHMTSNMQRTLAVLLLLLMHSADAALGRSLTLRMWQQAWCPKAAAAAATAALAASTAAAPAAATMLTGTAATESSSSSSNSVCRICYSSTSIM